MVAVAILTFAPFALLTSDIYVQNRSCNISTRFGDDWSNSGDITNVFRHLEKHISNITVITRNEFLDDNFQL